MKGLGYVWLTAFLIARLAAAAQASPIDGMGCEACHRLSVDAPLENRKAPDLFYAGDKLRKEWVERFLQRPVVLRKAGFFTAPGFLSGDPGAGPHLALGEADAKKAAGHLATLKLPGLETGLVDEEPLSKVGRVKAKILFERDYGCIACHEGINLAGQARGGVSGPSLAGAGNRLKGDWIVHWLKTPERFIDKSRMPVYRLDAETLTRLTKYILSLKKEPDEWAH
ncbi:MAG: c-type cytochrome [Nitrospinaceae bacterium]|nr:MAG: c-type cytochrome [Nitrospinaceae bacterium]